VISKGRTERLAAGARKNEEEYFDEENTYVRIIRTGICKATDINPRNNKL
jgi:hypothetical protein